MAGVQIDGVNNKIDFDDDLDTSISANTDDTLVIEAGGNTMATITATTFTINDGTTITTADNSDTLTLISTDADANVGPNLNLYRNSGSPVDNDVTGVITYNGRNDNSQDVIYARQISYIKDASDGTEDGQLTLQTMVGGTIRDRLNITPTETVFNEDSIDLDFRVETNGQTHAIFAEGGTDRVGILNSSPQKVLDVTGDAKVSTDLTVGDDLFMLSDSSVIHFGADSEVFLTHEHNKGLKITTEGTADTLSLVSNDDGTAAGPTLELRRNSASPADNDGVGAIVWTTDNDAGQEFQAAIIKSQASDVSDGSEDSFLYFRTMHAGSETEHMAFLTTETVFNDASNDIDFRVESNDRTSMLNVDAGLNKVGVGFVPDLGFLHVKVADSGASVNTDHDTLVLEESGDSGISILSGTSDDGAICFGDSGNNCIGYIVYSHSSNHMAFAANNAERMRIDSAGKVGIGTGSPEQNFHVEASNTGQMFRFKNLSTSGGTAGGLIQYSYAPDDNGNHFLYGTDTVANRFFINSDGDIKNHDNSYGAISDERIKQDIVDANSQWNDIKAVKVRNYKKKDDVRQYGDNAWSQIGVIAQELETVSPKLIKESVPTAFDILSDSAFGTLYTSDDAETQDAVLYTSDDQEVIDGDKNVGDIKTPSTKQVGDIKSLTGEKVKGVSYSVLYMKAIKALQEAQTRIETLETKVAALEG